MILTWYWTTFQKHRLVPRGGEETGDRPPNQCLTARHTCAGLPPPPPLDRDVLQKHVATRAADTVVGHERGFGPRQAARAPRLWRPLWWRSAAVHMAGFRSTCTGTCREMVRLHGARSWLSLVDGRRCRLKLSGPSSRSGLQVTMHQLRLLMNVT